MVVANSLARMKKRKPPTLCERKSSPKKNFAVKQCKSKNELLWLGNETSKALENIFQA